jgi:hypothetical protein
MIQKLRITRAALLSLLASIAVLSWMPQAVAFQQYGGNTNCQGCHGDYRANGYVSQKDGTHWNDDLHDPHRNDWLNGDCDTCHTSGGRTPVLLGSSNGGNGLPGVSCTGCHEPVGLRAHHINAGAVQPGAPEFCADCHDDPAPSPESALPIYYSILPDTNHPNKPTDPCNTPPFPTTDGNENKFGPTGLDNDGDLLDDAADPDCAVTPQNQAPVANNDTASTPRNTQVTIDVLDNDTDDGLPNPPATITVASVIPGSGGTPVNNTTDVTFTPDTNICGVATFQYTLTDSQLTSNTATVSVTVGDLNPPVMSGPTPANLTLTVPAGTTSVPATDQPIASWLVSVSANDAVDGALPASNNAPNDFPLGTTTVVFSATDLCGNTATVSGTVTVSQAANNVPTVTAPALISVTAPLCEVSVPLTTPAIQTFLNSATATDVEDGDLTASITDNAPANFPLGPTTVTFSAMDSLNATGTADSSVTVNETPNSAPVVTAPAPLTITVAQGTTSVPASDPAIQAFLAAATATDAEDGTLTVSNNAPANFAVGTTTVTFSATDSCGLNVIATSTVTVQVVGNTAPLLTPPAAQTVDGPLCATAVARTDPAIAAWLGSATATDAEDGDLTASITNNAPASFPAARAPGVPTQVTFSVTDNGNPPAPPATSTASSTLTVVDPNTAPVVTAPNTLTITLPAGTDPATTVPVTDPAIQAFLAAASATDAEDGVLVVSKDAPTDFPVGTTTVTFSATDGCGVISSAQSAVLIEIAGNQAPVVTAPDPVSVVAPLCAVSVPATEPTIAGFLAGATAEDPEDGTLPVFNDAPANFPLNLTTVTFTATDSLDLSGAADSTVTVIETPNTTPTVTAPAPITITVPVGTTSLPASDPAIQAFLDGASADDAQDGPLPVVKNAPSDFPLGTTTVTFTAEDSCGAIGSATSTVTVQEEVVVVVDLDIAQLRVTKSVRLARVGPISIQLTVQNNGTEEGDTPATIVGVQDGVVVYNETLTVSDGVGNGRTKWDFPSYTPGVDGPAVAGTIVWTATIADGDPDVDEATATTTVR